MTEAERVIAILREKGKTVATAESCTGGLLGKLLTDISGSSAVYPGGIISYCNEIKHDILNVDQEILDKEGPVCEEVAKQMAEGVRMLFGTDYGLSTTGIAGPNGDGSGKPVGLVYVAVADEEDTQVFELHLTGNRDTVREKASEILFQHLIERCGGTD